MYHIVARHLPYDLKVRVKQAQRSLKAYISPPLVPDVVVPQQLTPATMRKIVQTYHSLTSEAQQESMSRALMQQLALDSAYGHLLNTQYFKINFENEELFQQAAAAIKFAQGDFEGALAIFEAVAAQNPTPFNYLCLARCLTVGLGREAEAITRLDEMLKRFPRDLSLIMNLATAHFRLGNTKAANECLDEVKHELPAFKALTPEIDYLANEISTALKQGLTVRPTGPGGDDYEESNIQERVWELYWCSMHTHNRFQSFGNLSYLYQDKIKNILITQSPQIRQVINFGVMCAHPDYCLAQQFPEISFIGIDREKITAELNRQAYQTPNLQFIAANIMDVLPNLVKKGEPTLLFHARTATLCYPQFVRNFYQACSQQGVETIALFENMSLSRQFMRFYDFSDLPADSIPYRSIQFIHNYEKFLNEAGYTVVLAERISGLNLLESKSVLGDTHVFLVAQRR